MKQERTVSLKQMKEVLSNEVGSKFPIKITHKNGEISIRYMRGFADQQSNILLISETSYSLALKILEVKDIMTLEYASENPEGTWNTIRAKWNYKSMEL